MKLQITVDGKAYAVDVEVLEDEEAAPEVAPHHGAHADAGPFAQGNGGAWDRDGKVCHSPVTGLVIKVNVTAGQAVEAGELIFVLEAMKMETNLTALHSGIVKSVVVAPGDPVKLNQVLVEFE